MNPPRSPAAIAFEGDRRIAAGDLHEVARAAKATLDHHSDTTILVFDGRTGAPIDLDFRGSINDVLARLPEGPPASPDDTAPPASRGRGRPKLGVVAREVTLLPRHWDWLAQQRGGASVALRRLVEQARRGGDDKDRPRQAQEAAYRFMAAMAGNRPHYEEAIRALFAPDRARFEKLIAGWPVDVRDHALMLAENAFHASAGARAVDPANVNR
jgi:hypothetical protein